MFMKIFDVNEKLLNKKYSDMLDAMRGEALSFCENFKDDPNALSDWGHNYFCPADGELLIFDLNKPHAHECRLCHTVYQTKTLDDVWTYFYRNEAIVSMMKLAVLYHTDNKKEYLDEYKKILGFYSDNYTKFAFHSKDKIIEDIENHQGGGGRLMPQGLNEAILIVRIVLSLELLKNDLDKEFIDGVRENFFAEATRLLKPQIKSIHNIHCWLGCALASIALFNEDEELLDFALNSELGVNNQLIKGVTSDRFWYEGSIHYNFFLLESVVYLLGFCTEYDKKLDAMNIVEEMLIQAYHYAFNDDIFPNPNDGWPNLDLKTYEYIYCVASKVFPEDSQVMDIYKHLLASTHERHELPLVKPYYHKNKISYERLICQPDLDFNNRNEIPRHSVNFVNSYFGMVKNENVNVFMKYGHRSPSHAHADKMNIEVRIREACLSRDLSNTGYACSLCDQWHKKSSAHNTVSVDGLSHVSTDGGISLEFSDNVCHAEVLNVYDGVDFNRRIEISENGFTDKFKVNSNTSHTFDYFFHSEAELLSEINAEDTNLGFTTDGYEHIKDVKKLNTNDDKLTLKWKLNNFVIESVIDTTDKEVFIAKTYDNPISSYRTAIILRAKAETADFQVVWNIKD